MWKRIVLATLVVLLVVFALPGCGIFGISQDEYNSLQSQLTQSEQERATLEQEVSSQKSQLDELTASDNVLQTSYNTLQVLRIGHLLADYYNSVRADHSYSTYQDRVNFAAELANHGLGKMYWAGSYEDAYYSHANEHSSTTARRELDKVLNVIGVQVTDSPTQKIDKILDFITAHIHYEYDLDDVHLAPMETLGFLSGDCDDFTTLAAALFEAVGIDSAVGEFQGPSGGHAMTLVHLDDISPYGYYSYADLTSLGLQSGKWVIIEPQHTIENQMTDAMDDQLTNQLTVKAAAEV